jgi:LemA protein
MTKKYIIIGVVVVVLLYGLFSYNGLVSAKESVTTQWAQVETQYQRRFDLIPNLVESVKGVLKQEQTIFTALSQARAKYSVAKTISEKSLAATEVESAFGRLLAIVENYPQLKSSENIQTLMSQLEGTENRVAVERKRFNDSVLVYNLKIKTFPSNLIARLGGFSEMNYFEAEKEAAAAPKVNF